MKEEQSQVGSALTVIEQQERANIDMLVATAKRYPRDLVSVKRAMEAMATLDEETAQSCNYHLERSGISIDGPSVRMAEIAVACYQNVRAGSRVVSNDGKTIVGQAFCHDLENNVFVAWETARRITDKKGNTFSEDMQVTTGNAAAAIAFRNAVLKVIPAALVKPIAEEARKVAFGDAKTLSYRRSRAFHKFAAMGVKEEKVLAYLSKSSVEAVDVADVEKLYGVFTAIKEGSTTIDETFPDKLPVRPAEFKKKEHVEANQDIGSNVPKIKTDSNPIDSKEESPVEILAANLVKDHVTTAEVISALIEHAQPMGEKNEARDFREIALSDLPPETVEKAIKQWPTIIFCIHKNRTLAKENERS